MISYRTLNYDKSPAASWGSRVKVKTMQDDLTAADRASPHPLIDLSWIREAAGDASLTLSECLQVQDIVGPNALVDPAFYRENYGREIPKGMSCLEHFCRQQRERPRDPNPLFSMRQWHETLGWRVSRERSWKSEFFSSFGKEARFARREMARQARREAILKREVVGKEPLPGQEVCLFVHFDLNDKVQPYVHDYLVALKDQGVSTVFLTNSHTLSRDAMERLSRSVWQVVCCDNRAYDWGLYSIGVKLLDDLNCTGHPIIFANDSVIGTMSSLSPLFEEARSGQYQITGAIDSLLHDWHLQSFFIYCCAEVISGPAWEGFWRAYRPAMDRWFVVNGQELGFSRWMTRKGIAMGAAWEYETIVRDGQDRTGSEWRRQLLNNREITNPTIELWDILLEADFPFLKKAVLTTPITAGNITVLSNLIGPRAARLRDIT